MVEFWHKRTRHPSLEVYRCGQRKIQLTSHPSQIHILQLHSRIDHVLHHKSNLSKIEIISNIFNNHNNMKKQQGKNCKKYKYIGINGFPCSSVSKESAYNVGDLGSIPGVGRCPVEWNGNPLQYSCLENPMDRGTWRAIVHGVARVGHDLASKPPP